MLSLRSLRHIEVADLADRLPNAGLEHPLDSVHGGSLILLHFYAAPRFLPFVLDGQRQTVAESPHSPEYTVTGLHDPGADLDQQLRRPHMRDCPSVCSGHVSEFHRGCSLARFRREAGHTGAIPQCVATAPPKTSRVFAGCCMTRPTR